MGHVSVKSYGELLARPLCRGCIVTAFCVCAGSFPVIQTDNEVRVNIGRSSGFSNYDCGYRALQVAVELLHVDGNDEEAIHGSGLTLGKLYTLGQIRNAALSLGVDCVAVKCHPSSLPAIPLPIIVALRNQGHRVGHFVVLYGRTDDGIRMIDYPNPPRVVSGEWLSKRGATVFLLMSRDQAMMQYVMNEMLKPRKLLEAFVLGVIGGVAVICSVLFLYYPGGKLRKAGPMTTFVYIPILFEFCGALLEFYALNDPIQEFC